MAQVNKLHKALLVAALAFEEHYTKERAKEQDEVSTMSEEELAELRENEDENFPEDIETEAYFDKFDEFVNDEGLESFLETSLEPSDEKRLDRILGR